MAVKRTGKFQKLGVGWYPLTLSAFGIDVEFIVNVEKIDQDGNVIACDGCWEKYIRLRSSKSSDQRG